MVAHSNPSRHGDHAGRGVDTVARAAAEGGAGAWVSARPTHVARATAAATHLDDERGRIMAAPTTVGAQVRRLVRCVEVTPRRSARLGPRDGNSPAAAVALSVRTPGTRTSRAGLLRGSFGDAVAQCMGVERPHG